ncbi:hypothetical protein VTI28DRAFT_649 [Corynascus sepedonium]
METNLTTHSATQSPDPVMAKILGRKYWNHFAIQLGHWNSLKVIIIHDEMFRHIPDSVKIEIARETSTFLNEDVMFARDADNLKVWILGPKKLICPNITLVGNTPVWDPKKMHTPAPLIKIPRPPNAYILYRKDKHNEVKARDPNLHNNEISVIIGAMWKGETAEVRAKYYQKAKEIKAHTMALHPTYRYAPRKSSEIRRRASRRARLQVFEHNLHQGAQVNNERASILPNSNTNHRVPPTQTFLPPIRDFGWMPYHPLLDVPTEPISESPAGENEITAEHSPNMNGGQVYPVVEELLWDIETDIARILAET